MKSYLKLVLEPDPIFEEAIDTGDKEDNLENSQKTPLSQLGSTLAEVADVPKVKLQISSGPIPPNFEFPELPYERRKRRKPGKVIAIWRYFETISKYIFDCIFQVRSKKIGLKFPYSCQQNEFILVQNKIICF